MGTPGSWAGQLLAPDIPMSCWVVGMGGRLFTLDSAVSCWALSMPLTYPPRHQVSEITPDANHRQHHSARDWPGRCPYTVRKGQEGPSGGPRGQAGALGRKMPPLALTQGQGRSWSRKCASSTLTKVPG